MADSRDASLAWAEQCRSARAEIRDELMTGTRTLAEVLHEDPGDEFRGRVRVQWILESVPGVRKIDVRRRLARLGIDATLELSELSPQDRDTLLSSDADTPDEGAPS